MLYTPQKKTVDDTAFRFKGFTGKRQKEMAFQMDEHKKMLRDQYNVRALNPCAVMPMEAQLRKDTC